MPRAEVYLEDSEQGPQAGAAVRFVFLEGFDPMSAAHQLANIIRAKLDEMAQAGELTPLSEREEHGDMSAANDDLAQRRQAKADLFDGANVIDEALVKPSK